MFCQRSLCSTPSSVTTCDPNCCCCCCCLDLKRFGTKDVYSDLTLVITQMEQREAYRAPAYWIGHPEYSHTRTLGAKAHVLLQSHLHVVVPPYWGSFQFWVVVSSSALLGAGNHFHCPESACRNSSLKGLYP